MKYFHCPTEYRRKAHGCGFGPVNATQMFLDLHGKCPRCQAALKPYNAGKERKRQLARQQRMQGMATAWRTFGMVAGMRYGKAHGLSQQEMQQVAASVTGNITLEVVS